MLVVSIRSDLESCEAHTIINIIHMAVWVERIIYDQSASQSVAILVPDVRMVPICPCLLVRIKPILKAVRWSYGALCNEGRSVRLRSSALVDSVPMLPRIHVYLSRIIPNLTMRLTMEVAVSILRSVRSLNTLSSNVSPFIARMTGPGNIPPASTALMNRIGLNKEFL